VQSVAFTLGAAQAFPRGWPPASLAIGGAILLASRAGVRTFLAPYAAAGMFDANLAVYGAGRIARRVIDQVSFGGTGLQLVGVYDDRTDSERQELPGLPVRGGLDDLIEAGRADCIDEIIIALPQSADRRIADIARRLEHLPVRIRICTHIASDLVDANLTRNKVSNIGPVGLLDVKAKPLADWAPLFKRLEDVVVGVPMLFAFIPVMLLVALAIKLDSPGPVLFRQKRGGLNHSVFQVLKVRTMRVMEEGAVVTQASRNDSRVTRVGRFLRRTSLDELPQLVNIVAGDMSLVGPRPHALVHDEKYGEMLERYANRHQVKPGLTGWAQINGYRGETQSPDDMRRRVEFDLAYIDHWSLLFDLKILALTPYYGFAGKNAF
jgi:Undecaprenyl-phosphate glucose phosphotransferase